MRLTLTPPTAAPVAPVVPPTSLIAPAARAALAARAVNRGLGPRAEADGPAAGNDGATFQAGAAAADIRAGSRPLTMTLILTGAVGDDADGAGPTEVTLTRVAEAA